MGRHDSARNISTECYVFFLFPSVCIRRAESGCEKGHKIRKDYVNRK